MSHDRGCRGFTLLEALVALALMSVVLTAGGMLIAESVGLIERTGRALRNPSTTLAGAALRRDVQQAAGVVGGSWSGWSREPLELLRQDGGRTLAAWDGAEIRRWELAPDGAESPPRTVLRGVADFRWRLVGASAVDVRIEVMTHPDGVRVGAGLPGAGGPSLRRIEVWRFAMRARGAGW